MKKETKADAGGRLQHPPRGGPFHGPGTVVNVLPFEGGGGDFAGAWAVQQNRWWLVGGRPMSDVCREAMPTTALRPVVEKEECCRITDRKINPSIISRVFW